MVSYALADRCKSADPAISFDVWTEMFLQARSAARGRPIAVERHDGGDWAAVTARKGVSQ